MGGLFSKDAFDPTNDLIDLKGKIVIVTGGERGIGCSTVKHLARAGAKVYIAARSGKIASEVIGGLKSEGLGPGNGEVVWLKFKGLSDPREAKKSAEEFLKLESRLDIIVHNATEIRGPFELTSDGVSTTVVVNYISPFVFTKVLLPLMAETARRDDRDVRIVNVSSDAMRLFPTDALEFKTIEHLNMEFKGVFSEALYRYGHAKLLGVMWVRALQKRFNESDPPLPITAITADPGTLKTFADDPQVPLIWQCFGRLFAEEVDRGAYNSVFAAASKQVGQERGKYGGECIEPIGKIVVPPKPATNDENREDLWKTTEEFLTRIGV